MWCDWCITQVTRYPTLILYRGNEQLHDYQDERDLDALHKFVFDIVERHDEL